VIGLQHHPGKMHWLHLVREEMPGGRYHGREGQAVRNRYRKVHQMRRLSAGLQI